MVRFPESLVKGYRHNNKHLRWGQGFYNYANLHKVRNKEDEHFLNQLYNEKDDKRARALVASRTDKGQ